MIRASHQIFLHELRRKNVNNFKSTIIQIRTEQKGTEIEKNQRMDHVQWRSTVSEGVKKLWKMENAMVLILLSVISLTISITSGAFVIKELENPNPNDDFSLMSKYGSDMIIVGGTNYIHRVFSGNLSIETSKQIGPKLDNPNCLNLEKVTCTKVLYNSYVKALLINKKTEPQQDEIIICTSLFQGSCEKRNASNLELLPKSYENTVNPVVANNKTATTVAFLAPGPKDTTAMYVGASWTNTGLRAIRGLVPALSSRNTEDFQFTHFSIATKSYTMLDEINKDSFPIRYIYGFASGNFSYVGTVQKPSIATEGYISKLIRVCLFDEHFYSYAENAFECQHNMETYNLLQTAYVGKPGSHLAASLQIQEDEDVLFGMFGHGTSNDLTNSNGESVLCIYPMRYVKQVFTRNIRRCFDGIGRTGPDHIATPNNCQKTTLVIGDEYCGQYDFNNPVNGPEAIKASLAISVNSTASSLIVTTTNAGYTVAFVGTKTGHIKKIVIDSGNYAKEYKDMVVESGSQILKDMFFDDNKRHLFVLTTKKLLKLVAQSCNQYTTCEECRGAKDPYCGWCSLANKCTLAEDCLEFNSPLKWMVYDGETCTKIIQVYPDKIQKDNNMTKTTSLTLRISNLLTYNGSYKCAFEGYDNKIETVATRSSVNVVKCDTPMPNELPPFPNGTDYITMRLSVIITEVKFVSTNFTFFDCEVHTKHSCYKCTLSSFNCTWCIKNHLCTHHPVRDCRSNDDFILGQNNTGMSIPNESGPNFCPSMDPSKYHNILVPSGIEKTIILNLIRIKPYQRPIKCAFAFHSETEPQGVIAEVFVMPVIVMIRCKKTRFFYPGDSEIYNVPMTILWGDKVPKPLDNPHNVQVIMYKCENMADTCGECLTQKEEYVCGWCRTANQCSVQSSCMSGDWLPNTSNCPSPIITRIYPLTGPKEGGTLLTIEGRDLGKSYEDIDNNVDIAGVLCSPIRTKYVISKKIVCTTGQFIGKEERSDRVRVTVALKLTAESKQNFTYVDPEITDITPVQGPKSGGTKVTIFGKELDCGSERKAYFGRSEYECRIDTKSITKSKITCETAQANKKGYTEELYMMFDNQLVKSDLVYKYVEDPTVSGVDRRISIVSGGLKVLVKGNGFLPIQNSSPKLIFYSPDRLKDPYYGVCKVRDDVTMECRTPQVESALITKKPNSQDQQGLAFGFIIDNVQNIRNISATHNEFFQIYPDPDISAFPNDKIK
ncbi:plexin-A4-like [Saccostrea cucullata]|uniref:plexin-A4-like n=1 Tax=Saccostrea cuccullata TaxID=36930 RepID=UPI002ED64601